MIRRKQTRAMSEDEYPYDLHSLDTAVVLGVAYGYKNVQRAQLFLPVLYYAAPSHLTPKISGVG